MKLLDTSVWVEYFKGTDKGKKIKIMLAEPQIYASAITFAEISKWLSENNISPEMAIEQIKVNSIIIDVEEAILIESGKRYVSLRKIKPKIGLIDTIIYISAILHGLTLVTGDFDFQGLLKVEMI